MVPFSCSMCSSQFTSVASPPLFCTTLLYSTSPSNLSPALHFANSSYTSLGCQPASPHLHHQPFQSHGCFFQFQSIPSTCSSIPRQFLQPWDLTSVMKSTGPHQTRCPPFSASFPADTARIRNSHGNESKERDGSNNKAPDGNAGSSFQWRNRADRSDGRNSVYRRRKSEDGSDGENVYRKTSSRDAGIGIAAVGAKPEDGSDGGNMYRRTFSRDAGIGSVAGGAVVSDGPGHGNVTHRQRYRDHWADKESNNSTEGNNGTYEIKKKKIPKIREQVRIFSPFNKSSHVAILGGGMSGLICALSLEERGIRSTVFDTGKHGLGGRMGTRHVDQLNGLPLVFDHAAQYFTVTDPRFQRLVNQWIAEGAVKEWDGIIGTLEKQGKFSELAPLNKYIATNGMRLLADHIVSKRQMIEVKRPCWISRMDEVDGMWRLTENGKFQGNFDMVVIAHNGKCANRLLAPAGVPFIAKQMKRLELSSIWALLAAFEEPLPPVNSRRGKVQLDGAFVHGFNPLSWVGNNTTKMMPLKGHGPHCWTFFSTAAYGKKHKVPQESIPTVKAERVKREMLQSVESAFGLAEGTLPAPSYTKVQLWGAALPVNTPNVPCIFDAYGRVGICGDWLLGSSLEAAALSGMAMANHIFNYCDKSGLKPEDFNVGLNKEFSWIGGHDIGQFPGQEQDSPVPEILSAA